jgi:hypothetical protein
VFRLLERASRDELCLDDQDDLCQLPELLSGC